MSVPENVGLTFRTTHDSVMLPSGAAMLKLVELEAKDPARVNAMLGVANNLVLTETMDVAAKRGYLSEPARLGKRVVISKKNIATNPPAA